MRTLLRVSARRVTVLAFVGSLVAMATLVPSQPTVASPPDSAFQEPIVHVRQSPMPIREWLGVDGEPLPFKDDEEIKDFLLNAEVTEQEEIPIGVTDPIRMTLEKDGITAHAVYRYLEIVYPRVRLRGVGVRMNLKDSCKFEAAAYELSRMLGMDNVPPTVRRRIGRDPGTLQIWVYNAMMETERVEQEINPPDRPAYMQQVQMMYLFDALIGNDDRTQENMLIDKNWKLWLIDHTRAFYPRAKSQYLDQVIHVDRAFWEGLQALDRASLGDVLDDYLTSSEINKIMERREPLVELIQGLIDSRGEGDVLYDWVPPERQ